MEEFYCRFCAELKNSNKLIYFNENAVIYQATEIKLKFLNASYTDILQHDNILPKTICISCNDSLCKAYEFMCNVKKAHETLFNKFCSNVDYKCEQSLSENTLITPSIDATLPKGFVNIVSDVINEKLSFPYELPLDEKNTINFAEMLNETLKVNVKHKKESRRKNRCEDVKINKSSKIKRLKKKGEYTNDDLTCTICDRTFNCRRSIYDHMINHRKSRKFNTPLRTPSRKPGTPITVEDLTCNICHKIYSNQNSLRDHKTIHTERKRDYTCDKCGKTFYKKGGLVTHIKIHEEVHPHVCKICNKSFTQLAFLRTHVQIHLGEKPFKCELCGRCFRLKRQLKSHSLIHTNILPFQCQYCEKRFRFSQILKNHERQHTGEKPYSCRECGRDFSNWSNYHKHTKRKHDIDIRKKINLKLENMVIEDPVGLQEWTSKILTPGKPGKKRKNTKEQNDMLDHINLNNIVVDVNQKVNMPESSFLAPIGSNSLILTNSI